MLITEEEKQLAHFSVETALKAGAGAVRVTVDKSVMDSVAMRDGTIDKTTHSADRSITATILTEGRKGLFSTNLLEKDSLEKFIRNAVACTALLAPDAARTLPDPARQCRNALTGLEAGLYDAEYENVDSGRRVDFAGQESAAAGNVPEGVRLISTEIEYSDSVDDSYKIDSQGFEGRHTETGFSCISQVTVMDSKGERFSGSSWESRPCLKDLEPGKSSATATRRACGQIGAAKKRSGKYCMVLENTVASTFVAPIISAVSGGNIQQNYSFLTGKLGEKVFPEGLSIIDRPLDFGKAGARLFDSEGVATGEMPIVGKGVIENYLLTTYYSNKLGLPPTVDDVYRPVLLQFGENALTLEDIVGLCHRGILVTGINGGNCNPVTGDFSYGVEGFSIAGGKIGSPIREMLVTGNIITLWNRLIAAGNDARKSARWQIPTLAFEDVTFSA